ncbi:hypothetical protein SERLA73DRAFT_83760 [Serpula lacrymans var. lacrymans S7.3]|uniref:Kinesin-like protein n=2 Tax=Serpula lacrymans var. lacrymans TaxID=341189 RepID=F8PIN6_SERL3|nr:uncharacterized protein SERLADRAFT_433519 [Serpula lacrymans var. lacrymans S7.9]EGO03669.1 hypothetical protein SERLA73DRAFT_83760 [Serpula lacrymans var. lacrymans S7.3]EGO29532.1 hypothetical protein SERLADRAFT_433519 [Serpula lacrymans var. lacrymans S7.9]
MSALQRIRIAARLRPRIDGEVEDTSIQVIHSDQAASCISIANPRDPTQVFKFPFSSCYDQSSTQEEIFDRDVQPLINVVYSGVTVTIFAYGVTSSGKTHTMQGSKSQPGVIPRVVTAMFQQKSSLHRSNVSLAVSYMEIYKDEVYDLLVNRETAPKLPVRENDVGQVFVANLTSIPINSIEEFDAIYLQASKHRSVGSTNLNHASSRSHAVLTIEVTMTDSSEEKTLTGKINLVDLAGSENNKLTGNDPTRMSESSAINKSLSVLGQVVHALNQGASRIPYRNSKLTRILQDALGGSSVGLLICNLAPGVKFRQDTLNTLNFAVRTKNVENRPVINERNNKPKPKPHFAAIQPPPPKLAPAVLQPVSTAGSSSGPSRQSLVPGPRQSLAGFSRVPRVSGFGIGPSTSLPTRLRSSGGVAAVKEKEPGGMQLTDKDIDERIAKAVEMEVARRLEEREKERVKDEEERRAKEQAAAEQEKSASFDQRGDQKLPPGILTPLLRKHRDLDDELKTRLEELEEKFERGNKETQLADVLSPLSKKKTGRAYVALARAHSEKGDLQVALELYRKAESYVPDNIKLKERIIEIEWAAKNNKEFVPSPKKVKKVKTKKRKDVKGVADGLGHAQGGRESDVFDNGKGKRKQDGPSFGIEVTNSPFKKIKTEGWEDSIGTPPGQYHNIKAEGNDELEWASARNSIDMEDAA